MMHHSEQVRLIELAVTSPSIAQPLTLRTSPSDYATFNQINAFVINIRVALGKKKQKKVFTLCFHC